MSDQADALRRLVRSRADGASDEDKALAGTALTERPTSPRWRLAALFAAIASRWDRRDRADCSA
jgi:hypothetical protein